MSPGAAGDNEPCFWLLAEGSNMVTNCVFSVAPSLGATAQHYGDQRFESPQLHQEVGANRRDFLRQRIARHSRGLRRVCAAAF
jgi:hypothetical protein